MVNRGSSHDDTLASLGRRIHACFFDLWQTCPDAAITSDSLKQKVLNERERFELWAINIGLYHSGHSSLDYRFRDAPPFADFARHLLSELASLIQAVQTALLEEASSSEVKAQRDDAPPATAPQEEAARNGAEGASDGTREPSDNSSIESFGSYEEESLTDATLQSIVDNIDRLYRLSLKIRNPATRIGSSKAWSFRQVDEDTGVNIIDVYAQFDKSHVQHVFAASRKEDPATFRDHYPVERLTIANRRRRQQFGHWRRHRVKLEKGHELQREPNILKNEKPTLEMNQGPTEPAVDQVEPSAVESRPTTATRLDPTKIDLRDDKSIVSDRTALVFENASDGDQVKVPRLSERLRYQKEFECPYCFTVCSRKTAEPSAWEAHVFRDLRPYVCTYEQCLNPTQIYDTFRDWADHELRLHHAENNDSKSQSRDESAQLKACEELGHILNKASCRTCPVCNENVEGLLKWQNHTALHLRRIALFTLPRFTGLEEEGEDEQIDSGDANAAATSIDSREHDFETNSLHLNEDAPRSKSNELSEIFYRLVLARRVVRNLKRNVKAGRKQGADLLTKSPRYMTEKELASLSDPMQNNRAPDATRLAKMWFNRHQGFDHWAFNLAVPPSLHEIPLSSSAEKGSRCYDTPFDDVLSYLKDKEYTLLFELEAEDPRAFNVRLYLRHLDARARIVCIDTSSVPKYYCKPLNSLKTYRENASLLLCQPRSKDLSTSDLWARLTFSTIEMLLMFHCTFLALRTQETARPVSMEAASDSVLEQTRQYFGGLMIDGLDECALRLFRDDVSRTVFLKASVLVGQEDHDPIWLAFINANHRDPKWLEQARSMPRKVLFKELDCYVFTNNHHSPPKDLEERNELTFATQEDADSFIATILDIPYILDAVDRDPG